MAFMFVGSTKARNEKGNPFNIAVLLIEIGKLAPWIGTKIVAIDNIDPAINKYLFFTILKPAPFLSKEMVDNYLTIL